MVLLDPQRAFEPAFGADSFARHLQGCTGACARGDRRPRCRSTSTRRRISRRSPPRSAMQPTRSRNWFGPWRSAGARARSRGPGRSRPRITPGAAQPRADLDRARGRAAGSRSRRTRHLLPKGVPAAHAAVPGLLPLLHVRQGAEAPEEPVHVDRAGGLGRGRGRAARLQGSVVYARRAAGAALPRRAAWLAEHGFSSTLHYLAAAAAAVRDRTGLLPHINAGCMSRARDGDASAGVRIDGLDAGEHGGAPVREGRSALWLAGQGAGRAARDPSPRRAAKDSIHHRHLDRYRRDPGRAHRGARRDSRAPSALRAHSGDHRSEFRAEAGHDHGRARRRRCGGAPLVHRGCASDLRAAHEHSGAAELVAGAAARPDRSRHQRLGRGVAADTRFRQPRGALAANRAICVPRPRRPARRSPSG